MPEGLKTEDPKLKADEARKAFEQEFERFARFRAAIAPASLTLKEAETLQRELQEMRTRAVGKKSELATLKKMVGRVAPEERASFGQQIQQLEAEVLQALEEAARSLDVSID
ncbi:MAG: hypothetical protein ICV68_12120, partial [Pyrinomonadaceae bacterium]|nr:hypothetical protein [Pyrinomonadaceae bacterium]